MGALALAQLLRIAFVARGTCELWRRVKAVASQHATIFLACTLRAINSAHHSHMLVGLGGMESATKIALAALPMMLQFWAFTLLVFQWAAIYHLSMASNPLSRMRPYFLGLNLLYGLIIVVVIAVVSLVNPLQAHINLKTAILGASLAMGALTFVGSLSFLIYGSLLSRILHAGSSKRRMTQRFPEKGVEILGDRHWMGRCAPKFCLHNKRDVRRMLQVALMVSLSLAGEAVMWCLAGAEADFEHLDNYTAGYLTCDILAFLSLLLIYRVPVTNIAQGRRAFGSASVSTQMVELSQRSVSRSAPVPRGSLTPPGPVPTRRSSSAPASLDCPMVISPTSILKGSPSRPLSSQPVTLSPTRSSSPSRRRGDKKAHSVTFSDKCGTDDFLPDIPIINLPPSMLGSSSSSNSHDKDTVVPAWLDLSRYPTSILRAFALSKNMTLVRGQEKSVEALVEAREFPADSGRLGATVLEAMRFSMRDLDQFVAEQSRAVRKVGATKPRLPHRLDLFYGSMPSSDSCSTLELPVESPPASPEASPVRGPPPPSRSLRYLCEEVHLPHPQSFCEEMTANESHSNLKSAASDDSGTPGRGTLTPSKDPRRYYGEIQLPRPESFYGCMTPSESCSNFESADCVDSGPQVQQRVRPLPPRKPAPLRAISESKADGWSLTSGNYEPRGSGLSYEFSNSFSGTEGMARFFDRSTSNLSEILETHESCSRESEGSGVNSIVWPHTNSPSTSNPRLQARGNVDQRDSHPTRDPPPPSRAVRRLYDERKHDLI